LATPADCRACLERFGFSSGRLHQAERVLCGVGSEAYDGALRRAFAGAYAVLVVEPSAAALVGPYCPSVQVVPSGFDPARFPWPWPAEPPRLSDKTSIVMAGVVEDPIKGFAVLHAACQRLWQVRQDFELVATGQSVGRVDEFTRFVGWLDQAELPKFLRAADVVALPALGQEALGRTAVEAMAVGRPVVASRVGGLPHTISGGAGLLVESGDAVDLARTLERLLNDTPLRERMGQAGRRRFEEHYTWDVMIERHYRPLLDRHAASARRAG
jgi:glycosyltransferase involved in cell wall biosynthesis